MLAHATREGSGYLQAVCPVPHVFMLICALTHIACFIVCTAVCELSESKLIAYFAFKSSSTTDGLYMDAVAI